MSSIADNIFEIFEQIHEFEQRYGRSRGSVALMGVSKKQTVEKMSQAYQAGLRDFGENYLQEAEEKMSRLNYNDIRWHFIGPVQSNKTRDIASRFQWVHSVDRIRIARRLSDQRPRDLPPLNICIQVNLSEEGSKSGVTPEATATLCQQTATLPNLRLRGLMAIPAAQSDFDDQRRQFRVLAQLFQQLSCDYPAFDTLSMGMSGDFEAAIAEGSTMIRIGTALFGSRI